MATVTQRVDGRDGRLQPLVIQRAGPPRMTWDPNHDSWDPMKSSVAASQLAEVGDLDRALNSLRRMVRAIRVSSRAAEDSLKISGAQLFVLQQLAAHPAASLGELAARTLTHQSSVSVVVSRLVARRLVARRASFADGRRIELSLTATGRALLARAPVLAQARLLQALRALPARDLRLVGRVLEGIAGAMDLEPGPPGMFFERDKQEPSSSGRRKK
jgi:DNA-binding MarR family transcriptional regulator